MLSLGEVFFFSNILCRGNPIFTNPESPTVNSFVFNDLGQYSFATAYSAPSVSSTNRASPAPLRRVRWIENDRFWVSTKSPWNLFIRCVNVRTNPLDSLFTDDRRVIELTAKSQGKCSNRRDRNKMAVIGKWEKRKSKPIKPADFKGWTYTSDCGPREGMKVWANKQSLCFQISHN